MENPYEKSDYAMLPVAVLINTQKLGEKETYLKTYYLIDFNDFNTTLQIKNKSSKEADLNITLGKIGDNYWSGYCDIFHLTTNFYISDLSAIQNFVLKRMKFDDYMMVKLNGHVVKVGPYGGDRLEVVKGDFSNYVVYGDGKKGACELSTSWDKRYDEDFKQYLKQGINRVDIYVEVAGKGEGYVEFQAHMKNTDAISCQGDNCLIQPVKNNLKLDNEIYTPRILDEFLFLKREAIISKKDNSSFDIDNLIIKMSDGTWAITPRAIVKYKKFLEESKLRFTFYIPDEFLNNSLNKVYVPLSPMQTAIGVTNFNLMLESYEDYKKNKDKYSPKDRDFNKYEIKMDTSYKVTNVYTSTEYRFMKFLMKSDGNNVIRYGNTLYLDANKDWVFNLKDATGNCPSGFSKENGFCYKKLSSYMKKIYGLVPVKWQAGKYYDPETLKIDNMVDEWKIKMSDIDISKYVKHINLWDSLRRGNLIMPEWMALIDFNSFDNGKLFLIFDKKKNIEKLVNDIKNKGIDYLTNILDNDYIGDKNYLAWHMDKRYSNSVIYDGKYTFTGFKGVYVNKFIKMFGMHSYDTLCPNNFYFDTTNGLCKNDEHGLIATPFPDYFTNQLKEKNGPIYASYNKGMLYVRMVPEGGYKISDKESKIICPNDYNYSNNFKACVKYSKLKECSAPNSHYDFEHNVCLATPTCSNGGLFDELSGKCVKILPSTFKGKNGYYFIFDQDANNYYFYTPLSTPRKYKCVYQQYKCDINGKVFNNKSNCDLLCYAINSSGKKVYGKCSLISKKENNSYDTVEDCKYKCRTKEDNFNWYAKLYIKNSTLFNKYSKVKVYLNGKEIENATYTDGNGFYFGSSGTLIISNVKPGDEVKISVKSKFDGTQYLTGLGYWEDKIGDKTISIGDKRCYKLSNYFDPQNKITIGLDVDDDGKYDSSKVIPTFYCVSSNPFEKDINIKILGDGLYIDYFDEKLDNKTAKTKLEFFNNGICLADSKKDDTTVEPVFNSYLNKDFISNLKVKQLKDTYPGNSYFGIKDNKEIDKQKVLEFKKHFCFYPLQEEYRLIQSLNPEDFKTTFYLYKYFDQCPIYLDNDFSKIGGLRADEHKNTYQLGEETISKSDINLDSYSPKDVYEAINSKHIVTLPTGGGHVLDDDYFVQTSYINKKSISVGYGYSPFDDCRHIDGVSVRTDIKYIPKTNCNYRFGKWTYDSNLKKCVSNPTKYGCMYGQYKNGKCVLEPKCPTGYMNYSKDKCKKIIATQYSTEKLMCKPWWTLKRKYVCDNLNSLIGGYIYGFPRWLNIKQVPIYRYQEYNFNKK
jgi:hypothetical protein